MKFNPLVSCVVPIYNAERYLHEGIQSLLSQTYKNFEIILVDDHSSDGSWQICEKYSKQYSNVFSFQTKKNSGGPLRGREMGIKEAHGEWITFMDGDDYVRSRYIENLVKATNKGKYDIAVTGYSKLHTDGKIEDFIWQDYSQTTADRIATFYKHFLTHDFWTDPTDTVGQQLIRASICKAANLTRYSNTIYAEDTLMALAFLVNTKKGINFTDQHDFIWRQVPGSGSHGGFSERANQSEFYEACLQLFHDPTIYKGISERLPLISLVIPVYNVEKYISDCLESVLGQSYRNIEIIVVNDGSMDGSQGIIESYRHQDTRIITIKQKNMGLNMARAAGVKVAQGELISFIDSDDMVHEDYLKILFENLLTNKVDISVAGFTNFHTTTELHSHKTTLTPNYAEQVIRGRQSILRYYLADIPSVPNVYQMTAWGKLFSMSIVKKTDWQFSNFRRHEDNLESIQWYKNALNGISVISTPLYYYRRNEASITNTIQPNIGPDGRAHNYFEWLLILYRKTVNYIDDDTLSLAAINQLAHTNSIQARMYYSKGQIDESSMMSVIDNWGELIKLYNAQIQERDERIRHQERMLREMSDSLSWHATAPLRSTKKILKQLIRKLRNYRI